MELKVFELNENSFKLTLQSVFNEFPMPLFVGGGVMEMCVLSDVSKVHKFSFFKLSEYRDYCMYRRI
jgi:hypothetical protein